MKKLFGTDGMRGKAGTFPLDTRTVEITGRSLAIHLRETSGHTPSIVIGRDTRESGPWIERALISGASSAGAVCQSAGVITTPGVAYLARTLPADAGVVISASHNEYKDNGIKIFAPSGRKLNEQTERLIEADIYAQTTPGRNNEKEQAERDVDHPEAKGLQERYLHFLEREIGNGLSLNGLTMVVDCAHGAASRLAPELFQRLGANVVVINNAPDGRNINLNSGSLHIDGLREVVKAKQAHLGVAFDGDADRSLFVDEHGEYVDGDATLWVMAKYLKERGELTNSAVVATVMSNIGLEIALKSQGIQLSRTDVGDKHVLEELLRSGAALGGEQSGHIIFPRLSLAGDGMITTLRLLSVIVETNATLSDLTAGFERYPQVLLNVPVREKRPFSEISGLSDLVRHTESELRESGRLLLRYSGTELLARIMIEGQNQAVIEGYAKNIAKVIRENIGAI